MKSYEEVCQEVIGIIAKHLHIAPNNISDANTISSLTRDSIQLFELLLAFEQHYKMETAYTDVVQIHTVRDAVQLVANKKYRLQPALR